MGFIEAVKSVMCRWDDFSTRSSRSEYWYWVLFNFLVAVVFAILIRLPLIGGLFSYISWAFGVLTFIPSISIAVRRLHDTGRSGLWILINLIPLIGNLIYLYWMIKRGDEKPNEWGKIL